MLKHGISKIKCLSNAEWDGYSLRCTVCKREMAFRYRINEEVIIYVIPEYESFSRKIESREDNRQITGSGDLLGATDFREFEELLSDIQQRKDSIFSLPLDFDGFEENWKSEISDGLGQTDYIIDEEPIENEE